MSDRTRNLTRKNRVSARRALGKLKSPKIKWYYYSLDFNYIGPRANFPDESEMEASYANWDAEKLVEKRAEKLGIQMRHAYSWPDGSLYKYVRTSKPTTTHQFKSLFDQPTVGVVKANLLDHKEVAFGELNSVEERFTFNRSAQWALQKQRQKEIDLCTKEYHDHRKDCPVGNCSKSGYGGCEVAQDLFNRGWHEKDNYLRKLSGKEPIPYVRPIPHAEREGGCYVHLQMNPPAVTTRDW